LEQKKMASTQDTEITLGTGKMLALFFGLVVLCAVFFGMGFSLGKNAVRQPEIAEATPVPTSATNVRPTAVKPASANADMTFYKAVGQKQADADLSTPDASSSSTPAESKPSSQAAPASAGAYLVQVAAVSKQEDADALVDALKKKQYSAFAANNAPSDKLIHVQVGPFSDIKDAEATRAKLVGDGYNPILKK
jgi:DedD protein